MENPEKEALFNKRKEAILKRIEKAKSSAEKTFRLALVDLDDEAKKEIWAALLDCNEWEHLAIATEKVEYLDGLHRLTKLTNLDLEGKGAEFTGELSLLTNLHHLGFRYAEIDHLPQFIANLPSLHCLHLNNLQLDDLPNFSTRNQTLVKLDLSGNRFSIFPKAVFSLINLQYLDISENSLNTLPAELASLRKIKSLNIENNPFSDMPQIKNMGHAELFYFLDGLRGVKTYATVWDVPEMLTTALKQYLIYFNDFVQKLTGERIRFEVLSVDEGLKLTATTTEKLTIKEINDYLYMYITHNRDTIETKLSNATALLELKYQGLMREWEMERMQLYHKVEMQLNVNRFLEDKVKSKEEVIENLQARIRFFEDSQEQLMRLIPNGKGIEVSINLLPPPANNPIQFDSEAFLMELYKKLQRMAERKYSHNLEDLHNDVMTDFLRDKGYVIADQSRSGRSWFGTGEVDLLVRDSDGTPVTILETFRAKSCGAQDKNISKHLHKLLHHYDTIGHETNFVIVYVEQKKFDDFWENYKTYMEHLNEKEDFGKDYPLISFKDTHLSNKMDLKIGVAKHHRNGSVVTVYHLLVHFYQE